MKGTVERKRTTQNPIKNPINENSPYHPKRWNVPTLIFMSALTGSNVYLYSVIGKFTLQKQRKRGQISSLRYEAATFSFVSFVNICECKLTSSSTLKSPKHLCPAYRVNFSTITLSWIIMKKLFVKSRTINCQKSIWISYLIRRGNLVGSNCA